MKTILALDLGNEFGWAVKQTTISSGWERLSKNNKSPGKRFREFRFWLADQNDIDEVYFEDVKKHAGVLAAHAYGGYLAVLQMWAYNRGISCVGVGVGVIKKSWTGKGNASKQMMIDEAILREIDVCNHNEVDALALLEYAIKNNKK